VRQVPIFLFIAAAFAQKPENVLVVVNAKSPQSKQIANYYMNKRAIPATNRCMISTSPVEEIDRHTYDSQIGSAVQSCLTSKKLTEKILYIVTTLGVPLKIAGTGGPQGDCASVDSELTLLYSTIKGVKHALPGAANNPFYRQRDTPFQHSAFPIYLVTRLAAYDVNEVKAMIDRSLIARNKGKFVIDLNGSEDYEGNDWLRNAAILLPKDRVVLDATNNVISDQKDVIGYASWGSNDHNRKQRFLNFQWLPGAIVTEYVSTNGRTFARPPAGWELGASWAITDRPKWFAGSPQSLSADYIQEGATGASGNVYEPYLTYCPRPDLLFPAYFSGRTLAESFYLSIPALSWQNIVLGDPLCRLQ
jgi:uncharacterized protein (TIGR03790 family)